MGKKLYVGNLPYSATEATLRELFAPLGEVTSVSIITDRDSGRSKGFGFVEMATEAAAQQAISQLSGKTMDDRAITVAEARPQADRGGGGRSGGFGGGRGGYGGGRSSGGRGGRR
jgi:RNA recognition motif-containing protein